MATLPPNQLIESTSELAAQLTLEQKIYEMEMEKFPSTFDITDDIEYYILSTKFI